MLKRAYSVVALALLLLAIPFSAQEARAQEAAQAPGLPAGEGRELVAVACSQCHVLNVIASLREGEPGWRRHVYNMVLRGAQLDAREVDTVIKYLTNNLGPGAGHALPTKPITLPAGPGRELVESRCSTCHDLERVTIVKRSPPDWSAIMASMVGRGAAASPDEARTMVGYLTTQFGRAE